MKKSLIILLNLIFLLLAGYVLFNEFFSDRSSEWRNHPFLQNSDIFFLSVIVIGSFLALVRQFINNPKSGFTAVVVGVFIDSLVLLYSIFNVMASLVFLWMLIKNMSDIPDAATPVLAFVLIIGMGVLGVITLQQIFKRERALSGR